MLQKLKKDRAGVSQLVTTACMLFIILLVTGMLFQLIAIATAQLTVNAAAFSAARAAARSEEPYLTAKSVADEYGTSFLKDWENLSNVNFYSPEGLTPGSKITVEISYNVPQFISVFSSIEVKALSSQVMEELP